MTAPPAAGDILLGKYRVERVIGQGGMGMVVAARHMGLGELFAIKVMLAPGGPSGDQAVDRFLREARICASLKGDHVVKVQDVGQLEDGQPYMVMEYLQGQDLAKVIEKRGPLSIADAGAILLQTCDALAEAHALGIVHRDLKPANIFLIRKPNGKTRVKLLDFGISKRLNADTKALTASGAIMGSPLYMSPEQLSDARAVGPQSDIWAMGVILYELLTAHVPFDGEMIYQVIHQILSTEPKLPSSIRPELPAEVDRIAHRCLRKEPEKRYASIADFAMDLRDMLRANSVIAAGAHLLDLSKPGKLEEIIDIPIDVEPFDMAMAPTVEVISATDDKASSGSPASADAPGQMNPAKQQTGSSAPLAVTPAERVITQSPPSTQPSESLSSGRRSPLFMAMGAVLLMALGGSGAYLFLDPSRSTEGQAVPERGNKTAPKVTPDSQDKLAQNSPAGSVTAASSTDVVAAPSASSTTAASAAPPSPYLYPSLFRPKSSAAPPTSSASAPETTGTKKPREGLY